MPMIDKPVKDLEQYQGINPRPADFDAYWDKALAEMKAVDANVTMTPASFRASGVSCYDMYFTGVNGARIYVKMAVPKNITGKIPAVLRFHGYGYYNHCWSETLIYAATGVAVFFLDARGQNGKSEDVGGVKGNTYHGQIIRGLEDEDPHKLLFRDIFLDTAQLAGIVMDLPYIDETRVYATGGSQGGGLALACAALEPRISKTAVFYPFLSDYKRIWQMDLLNGTLREVKDYFKFFDPLHEREEEIWTRLGYIDVQHLANRIRSDTLMITGLMDNVVPPSTQYAAYNKLTCTKKHLIYPDYGHEGIKDMDDKIYDFLVNDIW